MSHSWHPPRSIYLPRSHPRFASYKHREVSGRPRPLAVPLSPSLSVLERQLGLSSRPRGLEAGLALPLYIDSSMLSLWRSCKRKHFWTTLNALYPSGQSVHLIAGGAIAAACEAARKWVFSQPSPVDTQHSDILEAAYPAFRDAWGDYQPPDNPRNAKTYVNTWSAFENYISLYPPGRDPVQPMLRADGTPAIEYRFAIPLPIDHPSGDPILFVGRFDMVGDYTFGTSKIPVILDEKTTSAFSMGWANSWDMRGQFMGYIWALQQQGFPIHHAVVRGIAIQKTQYDTREALVMYPQHMIDRWEDQLYRDVQAIVNSFRYFQDEGMTTDEAYPYNFADACNSYGGCAFSPLCFAADYRDFVSNYVRHVWNPLAPKPVEEIEST